MGRYITGCPLGNKLYRVAVEIVYSYLMCPAGIGNTA